MKIAIQAFSLHNDFTENFKRTAQKIKNMGYDGVELAGLYNMTAKQVKSILDDVGLEICSAHIGINELEKDEVLDAYSKIGVKSVVVPATPYAPHTENVEEIKAAAERMAEIGSRCNARGIKLYFHNHTAEFDKYGEKTAHEILFETAGLDKVKPQLDTAWVNCGGVDPVKLIRKYSDVTDIIHLKDFTGRREDRFVPFAYRNYPQDRQIPALTLTPVGGGVMRFPEIISECKKADIEWFIVEQDGPTPDHTDFECAEKSINYLRSILR